MNGTLTIAARELRERSFVLVTAAMISLTPFIAALLPHRGGTGTRSVIIVIGAIATAGLTLGLAIVLGGSIVGRELSERRLSFYFSKPVPASAIWFGKLAGAFAMIVLCFAITFLPSFLAAHGEWRSTWGFSLAGASAALLGLAAYLLLASHALTTMVRSRSPLIALDLALLAGFAALAWMIVRPLMLNGAVNLLAFVAGSILLMVPVSVLAGGVWQLSRGRTDIRRSHRELSRFFWIAMGIVIAAAAGYVAWIFSAGPRDLKIEQTTSNAAADWIGITGRALHRGDYDPTFLVDLRSGKSIRVPGARYLARGEFTHRGDAVVTVTQSVGLQGRGEVHVRRLDPPYAEESTGIATSLWSRVVLSDDLKRAAIYDGHILSVHDLAAKALLASVLVPFGDNGDVFFPSDDIVRLYARGSRGSNTHAVPLETRIYELDVKRRQLTQTGLVSAVAKAMITRVSADGSTLVVSEFGGSQGRRVRLADARTGAERGVVEGHAPYSVTALASGGIAFVSSNDGKAYLRIADARGSAVRDIPLGVPGVGTVREVTPGRTFVVNVLHGTATRTGANWTLLVVDAGRGSVQRVEQSSVLRIQVRGDDPRMPAPNASGEYVIADANNTLWRWNALTGAKTRIF